MKTRLTFIIAGLVLAVTLVMVAYGTPQTDRVNIRYVTPKDAAHQPIYLDIQRRGTLEKLKIFLSPLLLPRPLRIRTAGCDGEADAYYDFASITICYELIAELWENMPEETTRGGIEPIDTVVGPLFEIMLHETAHALFDLLELPVLGREEDAADQVAAYMLLRLGDEAARRLILGTARAYYFEAVREGDCRPLEQYSGEHSTPGQRAFNLLCLAYGGKKKLFSDFVSEGYLPKERAEWCFEEYEQVEYAFETLIRPHIDQELADRLRDRPWLCDWLEDSAEMKSEDCLLLPVE
jgi:hypothetical protein